MCHYGQLNKNMSQSKFNKAIKKLFIEDQSDRKNNVQKNNWVKISKNDNQRRKAIREIITKNKKNFTAQDYYMAAMIYQHGPSLTDSKKAILFARKSMELGYKKSKWLYAAAVDRFLMKQGKKQKYGTQFINKNGKWSLYKIDISTTDKERAKFNVEPLKISLKIAKDLNKERSRNNLI